MRKINMSATLCSYCKVYEVTISPELGTEWVFCSDRCRELSHSKNCGDPLLWREKDYCPRCLSLFKPFAQEMILNVQKDTIYCPKCRWQSKDIEESFEPCRVGATCMECKQGRLYLDLSIDPAVLRCGSCLLVLRTVPSTVKAICSNLNCSNYDESAGQLNPPQYCHNCKHREVCSAPNCQNKRTAGSTFCSVECQQVCLTTAKENRKTSLLAEEVKITKLTPGMFKEAREVYDSGVFSAITSGLKFPHPDKVSLEAFLNNGHFTQRSLLDAQAHICDVANCIMESKNSDYANEVVSVFQNFIISEQMSGVELVRGIFQRICDKMSRLRTFLDKGELAVKEEGLDNIAVDVINYMCIILCYQFEKKNASLQTTESGVATAGVPGPAEQGNPDGSSPTSAPTV